MKFLGIYIKENMKWNNDFKHLSSKLNTMYYVISSLKHVTSPHILRTMYFACFHAHLRYGLTLCGGSCLLKYFGKRNVDFHQIFIRQRSNKTFFVELHVDFEHSTAWITVTSIMD
jgi:hypothetical protein